MSNSTTQKCYTSENHHVFKFHSGSDESSDSCTLHLAYGNQNLTHDPEKLTCSDCTLAQKSEQQDKQTNLAYLLEFSVDARDKQSLGRVHMVVSHFG